MRWYALLLCLCMLPACATLTGITLAPFPADIIRNTKVNINATTSGEATGNWFNITVTHETAGKVLDSGWRSSPAYVWQLSQAVTIGGQSVLPPLGVDTVRIRAKHTGEPTTIVEDTATCTLWPDLNLTADREVGLAGMPNCFPVSPHVPIRGLHFRIYRDKGIRVDEFASRNGRTGVWYPGKAGTYRVSAVAYTDVGVAMEEIAYEVREPLTLTVNPTSCVQGQRVSLLATAYGFKPIQYMFEVRAGEGPIYSGTPTIIRDWAPGRSTIWTTSTPGTYTIYAHARMSPTGFSLSARAVYTVKPALALTADPPSPTVNGQRVALVASPAVPVNQYRFEVRNSAGAITFTRDWGTNRGAGWTPRAADTYTVRAYARYGDTGTVYSASLTYRAKPSLFVTLSIAKSSSSSKRGLTATVTGTDLGPIEYRFSASGPAGSNQGFIYDWTTRRTALWTPAIGGKYVVTVSVRELGLNGRTAEATMLYTVTEQPPAL